MIILSVLMIDFSVSFRINQEKTQVIRSAEPKPGSMTVCDMAQELFSSHAMSTEHQPKGEPLGFPRGTVIMEGERNWGLVSSEHEGNSNYALCKWLMSQSLFSRDCGSIICGCVVFSDVDILMDFNPFASNSSFKRGESTSHLKRKYSY